MCEKPTKSDILPDEMILVDRESVNITMAEMQHDPDPEAREQWMVENWHLGRNPLNDSEWAFIRQRLEPTARKVRSAIQDTELAEAITEVLAMRSRCESAPVPTELVIDRLRSAVGEHIVEALAGLEDICNGLPYRLESRLSLVTDRLKSADQTLADIIASLQGA